MTAGPFVDDRAAPPPSIDGPGPRSTIASTGDASAVGRAAVAGDLSVRAVVAAGRTRLTGLRSAFPLALRRTGAHRVHLVGTGAWPLGGDRVRLAIEVGPGARLDVDTVAASVALPGRVSRPSQLEVSVRVAAGGRLHLDLATTILAAGSWHHGRIDVDLGHGATFAYRDLVVLGREGEPGGRGEQRLDVVSPDGPVVRERLARSGGVRSPLIDGSARAVGSVVAVGGGPSPADPPPLGDLLPPSGRATAATVPDAAARGAVLELPTDGWRAVALGSDVATVDTWLEAAWRAAVTVG